MCACVCACVRRPRTRQIRQHVGSVVAVLVPRRLALVILRLHEPHKIVLLEPPSLLALLLEPRLRLRRLADLLWCVAHLLANLCTKARGAGAGGEDVR